MQVANPPRHPLRRLASRYRSQGFSARGALELVVVLTTAVTVGAGVLMWVVDRTGFPTIGAGLWWALQTVTTVGYGDTLPSTSVGRAVAAVVMLTGIAFLTVATATITAALVDAARRRVNRDEAGLRDEIAALRNDIEALQAELRSRS